MIKTSIKNGKQSPFYSLFKGKTIRGDVFSPSCARLMFVCFCACTCLWLKRDCVLRVSACREILWPQEKPERPINSPLSVYWLRWWRKRNAEDGGGWKEKPLQGIEPNMWSLILALDSKWRGLAEHLGRCLRLEEFNTDKTHQTSL